MGSSKFFSIFLFFFLSWALQGSSNDTQDLTRGLDSLAKGLAGISPQGHQTGAAVAADADAAPCLQKLIPCQPFMHSPSPPATCCSPLKDIIDHDSQCLCKVFNNPEILKGFNLTLDEAMKLPKACGIDVDVSVCKKATAPSASTTNPSPPANSGSSPGSSSDSSKSSSNAAVRVTHAASLWFIASVAALTFSAV
ncbi:non-specific lipid-transfer protein-like protein At2g13820 [Herrania umbratica]|uniref:Non-specific lipid-transfer protein-like protein At2g13820 n=1 Tax=Herrania umbratica TaxID=108875 RepID=A0A6J1AZ16_9ROSI|nr:non-specific lipid-transfer protein-like protein At2g13820 [Herrania umbratica]